MDSTPQPEAIPASRTDLRVFSIGHSTRAASEFLALLREFGVQVVIDVRRFPSSRRHPHFNQGTLRKLLAEHGLAYVWLEALGGHRHVSSPRVSEGDSSLQSGLRRADSSLTRAHGGDSPNAGLRVPAFRAYADTMHTQEFRRGVERLLAVAAQRPGAVMCAEKHYTKCHRRLLGDFLVAHGVEVIHILEKGRAEPHRLTPGALITPDRKVIYPGPPTLALGPGDGGGTDPKAI